MSKIYTFFDQTTREICYHVKPCSRHGSDSGGSVPQLEILEVSETRRKIKTGLAAGLY